MKGNNNDSGSDGVSSTTIDQLTFAKALASPDKATRDKTINALVKYLQSNKNDMEELEMLKLWKALYYCYWLSDKVLIQQELAVAITNMIINIKNSNNMQLYIRSFFRTIVREWGYIDQHRINKFYTLLRYMVREMFNLMKAKKWSSQVCDNMIIILKEEVLNKVPNGPRYQVVDVYLEELLQVTDGDIDTNTFIKCIEPFTQALGKVTDTIYHDRVIRGIFERYISDYAIDKRSKKEGVFSKVAPSAIQKIVFDIASAEGIIDKSRQQLYLLHREFPAITGKDFVDDDTISDDISSLSKNKDTNSTKKSKTTKNDISESDANNITKTTTTTTTTTKNTTSSISDSTKTNKTNTKRKTETNTDNHDDDNDKKSKKIKVDAVTPKKVDASASEPATNEEPKFIESKKFNGKRVGYFFQKGPKGIGYYIDPVQKIKSPNVKKVRWGGDDRDGKKVVARTPSPGTPSSVLKKTSSHKSTPAAKRR